MKMEILTTAPLAVKAQVGFLGLHTVRSSDQHLFAKSQLQEQCILDEYAD